MPSGVSGSSLLANRQAVVSEATMAADDNARRWQAGIAWTTTDQVVTTCQRLVENPPQSRELADRGWHLMQTLQESDVLARVLDQMATDHQI